MKLPIGKSSAKSALKIPSRRGAMETGIDGAALRVALTARHKEGGPKLRGDILEIFKQTRQTAMDEASKLFLAGRLGGLEMARRTAAIYDEILTALFDYTVTHIVRASNPTPRERMALCLVGGNGRGEMAPFSDIDLLFLLADKKGSAFTETVTEHMLYMLWDCLLYTSPSPRDRG